MGSKRKKRRVAIYAPVEGSKYLGTFDIKPNMSKSDILELVCKKGDTYISLCHQCSGEVFDGLEVVLEEDSLMLEDV